MDILFIQSGHRRVATVVTRQDGVRLSVPVFGPLDPLPHDLAHYVIELELELQDGFWGSVAAGAIFAGMQILAGRQPPHAAERSRAVLAAHHQGILVAEILVDAVLRSVRGVSLDDAPLPIDSPLVRTRTDLRALVARLRPPMDTMCARWQAIPLGGTFLVAWLDRGQRSDRGARRHPSHHASSGKQR